MTSEPLAIIPKNAREEIRIGLTEYHGHLLCAVRVFYEPADSGEKLPGKAGINVRVEQLPAIIDGLRKAAIAAGVAL